MEDKKFRIIIIRVAFAVLQQLTRHDLEVGKVRVTLRSTCHMLIASGQQRPREITVEEKALHCFSRGFQFFRESHITHVHKMKNISKTINAFMRFISDRAVHDHTHADPGQHIHRGPQLGNLLRSAKREQTRLGAVPRAAQGQAQSQRQVS